VFLSTIRVPGMGRFALAFVAVLLFGGTSASTEEPSKAIEALNRLRAGSRAPAALSFGRRLVTASSGHRQIRGGASCGRIATASR
jgi:hypothetical protein